MKKLFVSVTAAIALILAISIPSSQAINWTAAYAAENAASITPADGANLSNPTLSIYVGGTGDIKVDMIGGQTGVIFKAAQVGTILNIQATKVYATGTTATNLVALY